MYILSSICSITISVYTLIIIILLILGYLINLLSYEKLVAKISNNQYVSDLHVMKNEKLLKILMMHFGLIVYLFFSEVLRDVVRFKTLNGSIREKTNSLSLYEGYSMLYPKYKNELLTETRQIKLLKITSGTKGFVYKIIFNIFV